MPPQIEKSEGLKTHAHETHAREGFYYMPLTKVHSQGVLLSQGAGLTGVQPSQACNPHRRATLIGV
jgi:hypothetical protein